MLEIFETGPNPMQYWHMKASEQVAKWKSGEATGFSTGFPDVDTFGYFEPGDLIVIAARPSQGKTQLGLQICEEIAGQIETPGVVVIFSAEMPGESLLIRLASAKSGINSHKLRMGKGSAGEYKELEGALTALRTLPFWIDDSSGPTTDYMLTQIQRLTEDVPVRAMMFDFVELGGDRVKGGNEEQRISTIAHNLKGIAKTLRIPVIALSQLSRDVEKRASKRPVLSDLRYSGMLEQLADKIYFIMRPEYYVERGMGVDVPAGDEAGVAYIDVAKNRNGPVGTVRLAYIKERVQFATLERVPIMEEGWE